MKEDMIDGQPLPARQSASVCGRACPWPDNRHDLTQSVTAILRRSRGLTVADAIAAVAALHEDGIL